MTKSRGYYQRLLKRYIDNECTPQEAEELLNYFQDPSADRVLLEEMKVSFDQMLRESTPYETAAWSSKMRETLSGQIISPVKVIPLYKKWLPRAAAAILILSVSLAAYLYTKKQPNTTESISKTTVTPAAKEILPGNNKAILTLADGSVIILDEAGNGNIAKQGETVIDKKNGLVVYDASSAPSSPAAEVTYNTIKTPKGGQYQVVLPDGSKVWLNAASSLRFPTAFTGSTRNVELTGEGYFEIEKNPSMPFYVKANDMEVEVLGTHFNVMAYENEAAAKTTLLEGAVKLNYGTVTKTLKPGQQGRINHASGNMSIADADVDVAVAWKNGYFQFYKEEIKIIMRQFERWYDVEVSYEGKERPRYFSGGISRSVNLSQALKVLEASNIKFKIDNKKIVVLP